MLPGCQSMAPSNPSLQGAMLAALSGSLLGCGYALLSNDTRVSDVVRRSVGGAVFMAGAYMWAPASLRRAWLD